MSEPITLPPPRRYLPAASGRYQVRPGLSRLHSTNTGSAVEHCLFQLDGQFARYRAGKLTARADSLTKYVSPSALPAASALPVAAYLSRLLADEHPEYFALDRRGGAGYTLTCHLSAERLHLGSDFALRAVDAPEGVFPAYTCAWDALACQVQEDLCLVEVTATGDNNVHALHVCLPNHWAPAHMLGQDFSRVHAAVPHMDRINTHASRLLSLPQDGSAFVRFAWGVATDERLNHHPDPPADAIATDWRGRCFNRSNPRLFVRTERQTLSAIPVTRLILFTIRTYLDDVATYTPEERWSLADAIESMSEAAAAYKGLSGDRQTIVDWLRHG